MRPPWTLQLASDVVRDVLGWSFRETEATGHTVTVSVFEGGPPDDVLAELVQRARDRLVSFEDVLQPNSGTREVHESEVVAGGLLVSGRDCAKALERVEEAFDEVALAIEG